MTRIARSSAVALWAALATACDAGTDPVEWVGPRDLGPVQALFGVYAVDDSSGETAVVGRAYLQDRPAGAWPHAGLERGTCAEFRLAESALLPMPAPFDPPELRLGSRTAPLGRYETAAGTEYVSLLELPGGGETIAVTGVPSTVAWPAELTVDDPESFYAAATAGAEVPLVWRSQMQPRQARSARAAIYVDGIHGRTLVSCHLSDNGEAILPAAFSRLRFDLLSVYRADTAVDDAIGAPAVLMAARMLDLTPPRGDR